MRLVDLDPTWLTKDGKRVGFTFRIPTKPSAGRQSCFPAPVPGHQEQWDLFEQHHGDEEVQGCNPAGSWQIAGGIESASFETMTVAPSLDGSAGGNWHGFIQNGEIVGGL